jgi:hypothetical protein
VKYFFDHQTDALSFDLADAFAWAGSEPLASGVTLHLDFRGRPLMLEIQGASKIVDTMGLSPMQESRITWEEIAQRMTSTLTGERIWRNVIRRVLVPSFVPAENKRPAIPDLASPFSIR